MLQQRFVGERAYLLVTAATGTVATAAGLALAVRVGPQVLYLMLAGSFFVVFYTWPLKHVGLGELAVLIVWGPMMIAGGHFVLTGSMTISVFILSVIYGIAPTLVILGKHIDKASQDAPLGIRTLPVLLGDRQARLLSAPLLGCQWGLSAALATQWPWLLLALASIPAAWGLGNKLMREQPETRPEHYPAQLWPLWFSAFSFRYARSFGACTITALAITALVS
ncbi:MAG: prenyltransferase [Gammaproteobacteria bacterium]|nr:prenyltransferase [Gammaproteobacteria bacterium]